MSRGQAKELSDSVVFQVDDFTRGTKSDSKTAGIKIQKMEWIELDLQKARRKKGSLERIK